MTESIRVARQALSSEVGIAVASDPVVEFLLWSWRPEISLLCLGVGSAYVIGWWRLSRRTQQCLPLWRPALAIAALASLAMALLSPLDSLSEVLFSAHMLQHMLLLLAAPAFLLADPLPLVLWALPHAVRLRIGRLLAAGAVLRRVWWALTWMPIAWLTYTITLWVWHLPAAYEAALRSALLHNSEHLAFFWASVTFWWSIIDPAPHLRRPVDHALQIVYVVLAAFQKAGLALLLMLSSRVLYSFYAGVPRLLELSALEDQVWGGIIMWALGGAIDMLAVLVLLFNFFALEERRQERPTPIKADRPGK